jgi:hypothetical protein
MSIVAVTRICVQISVDCHNQRTKISSLDALHYIVYIGTSTAVENVGSIFFWGHPISDIHI